MKRALSALGAVAFALTLSACPTPPECEVNGDCEGTDICSAAGTCEPDPRPVRCDNGLLTCATTEVCDENDGACKTCTATAGCAGGTAICDTAANSGEGVCKTCLSDNTGCGSTAPICDTAAASGLGACIVCNATIGCRASQGETCDIAANGGAGACVSCLGDSDCSGATPVCTAGACVACRDDQTGTTADLGCSDVAAPLCDSATSTCKACVDDGAAAAADTGCDSASATPACYATGAGGAGACVQCTTNEHCTALTETPFCHQASNTCAATESGNALTEIAKIRAGTARYPASVTGAMVTNVRPATGAEPAGFFVQATRDGLGLFVVTLGGFDPQPGDLINMTVDSVITTDGLDRATITAGTIVSSGNDLSIFVTDISERTSWAAADIEALESKLVSGTGTIEGALFTG
ncbi:MAG: hypothetical protein M3Y59_20135, partial [Myxococcota bacterium]|nr:hypothetical protein [Myxococcota bacterium]